jgi:hypothetical protein
MAARTVAALALASAAVSAHAASYTFQNIVNNNDVTFNQELGINSSGQIAGYFGSGAQGHPNKGYTVVPPYGQANFTNENFPPSAQTQVTGINNAGVTVGFWSNSNLGVGMDSNFGFTDVGGTFTNVNNPNTPAVTPSFNQLLGVNNSNTAVGFYTDAAGVNHGYTYTIASNTFSANINDPKAGTGTGQGTTAAAINNSGEIAGFYVDAGNTTHGFIEQMNMFTTIDVIGSTFTQLLGINDNGLADGDFMDANGNTHGFLFNLNNDTFQILDDPSGIGTTTLNGINDLNQLVGFYVANENTIGLLADPTVTPLPASFPLFATGLGALGLLGWRRKRKARIGLLAVA